MYRVIITIEWHSVTVAKFVNDTQNVLYCNLYCPTYSDKHGRCKNGSYDALQEHAFVLPYLRFVLFFMYMLERSCEKVF